MAENPSNGLSWLLKIGAQYNEHLLPLRHREQLEIAAAGGELWVRGFVPAQLERIEVKAIPFKEIFYLKEEKLFPKGRLLPVGVMPEGLSWKAMESGLPLRLPSLNHNYFGMTETLHPQLRSAERIREPEALLTSLGLLGKYMETASAIRFSRLRWVILGEEALLLGSPLLPLPGTSFWRSGRLLLPSGMDLEWGALSVVLEKKWIPGEDAFVLWREDGNRLLIPEDSFQVLSLSSFRLSMEISS